MSVNAISSAITGASITATTTTTTTIIATISTDINAIISGNTNTTYPLCERTFAKTPTVIHSACRYVGRSVGPAKKKKVCST